MVKKKNKDELSIFIKKMSKEQKEKALQYFNRYEFCCFFHKGSERCNGQFEFQKGKIKLVIEYEDRKTEEFTNYIQCPVCKKAIPIKFMYGCYYYAMKYPGI